MRNVAEEEAVEWLTPAEAIARLTHPREQRLVAEKAFADANQCFEADKLDEAWQLLAAGAPARAFRRQFR